MGEDDKAREIEFVGGDVEEQVTCGLFNTFRIGDKWADLEKLEELDLTVVDGDDRWTLGRTVVLATDRGDLGDMLDKHVGLNHGVRHIPGAADQRLRLRNILEATYGRRLGDGEKCVVVYMYYGADTSE